MAAWLLWTLVAIRGDGAQAAEEGSSGTASPTGRGAEWCWMGVLQFETCCLPPPGGNAACWDAFYTYERCCGAAEGAAAQAVAGPGDEETASAGGSSEDLASLGGCELQFYQDFKGRARSWYESGVADLVLFYEIGYIVGHFKSIIESCAPAALMAMLMRLEARYFEEDTTWASLFVFYTEHHHRAVADGSLLQSHHDNGWPLVDGFRRTVALRGLDQQPPRRPRSGETLHLVVCYCGRGERIEWLRGFRGLPWREENRSASTKEHVSLHFYHKCGAPSAVEREEERQLLVAAWRPLFRQVLVRYVDDVVRADDCSAYLAYIVDHYDRLPEFTVFLHADAPEHIPSIELLTDVVFAAARGHLPPDVGFLHLAHNYVRHEGGCAGGPGTDDGTVPSGVANNGSQCGARDDEFEFAAMWRNVFGSSLVPSLDNGDLNAYCCVQFLVRRERIRLRSRHFYQEALAYFGESPASHFALFPAGQVVSFCDVRGRTPCQLAMYIWHVMFGEGLQLPRRHQDPRLPLFIRMVNIEREAVLEAQADADAIGLQLADVGHDGTYFQLQRLFQEGS